MKIQNIVNQLQNAVPLQTDLFTTTVNVSSLTRAGSTITAVTATEHNLSTGYVVNIVGAKDPYPVADLTFNSDTGQVTGITSIAHDLTVGFEQTFDITGANGIDRHPLTRAFQRQCLGKADNPCLSRRIINLPELTLLPVNG